MREEKPSVYVSVVIHNEKERLASLPDWEKKRRSMPDYGRTREEGQTNDPGYFDAKNGALLPKTKTGAPKPDSLFASQPIVPDLFTITSYHVNYAIGVHEWGIFGVFPSHERCKFSAKRVQQSCFEEEFLNGLLIIWQAPQQ